VLFTLASCKKENIESDKPTNMYDPVYVLNDNSGYEHVWDTTTAYGSISSSTGFVVRDFTVDTRNRMHFVYHYREEYFRRSLDLTSKKMIPQHPQAGKEQAIGGMYNIGNYNRDIEQYKPYTNYYVAAFQTESSSSGFSKIYLQGDIGISPMPTSYMTGVTELGYENVVVKDAWNTAHMYISLNRKDDEDFNYRFANTRLETAKPFTDSENITYILCDARTSGKSLYIGLENGTQLKAIEFDRNMDSTVRSGNVTATLNWTPPSDFAFIKAFRHYSADGTKLSFALLNYRTSPGSLTTFTYNFTTKELKKVLDNVLLSYGRVGSSEYLYDLDEEGNLYYAGYAENGTNDKGISIYKISSGNNTSLVGKDNFLKFGNVAKLKYLHGKIYLAIRGKKTGTEVQQLSFIKQK
jgi:hypothetical protein